jgi:putative integral membrane protein (TIGR02587 family)
VAREAPESPWASELADLVRGLSGAFLFGVPLLYTEEMWQLGARAAPWQLLVLLGLAFVANAGLDWGTGFKRGARSSPFLQAVEALAIGVVAALAMLLALNRLSLDDGLAALVGKVVVQTVTLSLGASVANAIFDPRRSREGEESSADGGPWAENARDAGATAIGAFVIGASIAPTQEVQLLAAAADVWHQLAVVGLSLAATYAIVFESGFDPRGAARPRGLFRRPISETALAYVVSLLVATLSLWTFHPPDGAPLADLLAQIVVLGLPAAIGGAAGRLVL